MLNKKSNIILHRLTVILLLRTGVRYVSSNETLGSEVHATCPDAKGDSGFPSAPIMNGSTLTGFTGTVTECCARCGNISILLSPWKQPRPSPYIRCAAYTHVAGRACLLHPSCSDLGARVLSQVDFD